MLPFVFVGLLLYGVSGASVERRQIVSICSQISCPVSMTISGPAIMPVCGSDGLTYSSRCTLSKMACERTLIGGTPLTMTHYGSCTGPDQPQVVSSHRDCNQICDEDTQPICASDGIVYQNRCLFQRAQCQAANKGTNIFLVIYADSCPTPRAADCSKYHIDTSDLAIEGNTLIGNMQCPTIDNHYVCSTDSRTYLNECLLCHYIDVHQDTHIKILHEGACHSTSQVLYPGGGVVSSGGIPILDGGSPVISEGVSAGSAGTGVVFPDQGLTIG